MNQVLIFAFLFFIGSCLGWCMEVFFRRFFSRANPERKWINPGFLAGPYLPLYGFGLWGMYAVSALSAVAMTPSKALDVAIILVIMAVVMTIIEYIAGIIFIPRYACETLGLHEGKRQYQRYHLPQVFSHMGPAWMCVLFLCQPICGGLGPLAFAASGIFLFHRHVFRSVRHRPLVFSQHLR